MRKVYDRLYTGRQPDCFEGAARWAVVHACREPCFLRARRRTRSADESSRSIEEGQNLYLDLTDGPAGQFSTDPFEAFLAFAFRHWEGGAGLLIHCNLGISRAPSLALLFLAKRLDALPGFSYGAASSAFCNLMPGYSPGEGIRSFLREQWSRL
jgi:hypothetical protein